MSSRSCTHCGAPLTPISSEEFKCEFCGKTTFEKAVSPQRAEELQQHVVQKEIIYVKEQIQNSEEDIKKNKSLGFWWWVLILLIPLVGVGTFFYFKSQGYTKKATQSITIAIIVFILNSIIILGL